MGHVVGLKICVLTSFYMLNVTPYVWPRQSARGRTRPRCALSTYGSTTSKLKPSPCMLGHEELGCMYDT